MSDLDNILDVTLDDLADLPEFKNFPAGVHSVLATFEAKEINSKPAVELALKYVECVELADPNETSPKEGDTCSTVYFLDNEFGQGALKKVAMPFAEALNLSSIREVVEQVKEVHCAAVTSLRADKNDKEKFYMQVKEISVV